eukprot:scpid68959/ scgid18160/ 
MDIEAEAAESVASDVSMEIGVGHIAGGHSTEAIADTTVCVKLSEETSNHQDAKTKPSGAEGKDADIVLSCESDSNVHSKTIIILDNSFELDFSFTSNAFPAPTPVNITYPSQIDVLAETKGYSFLRDLIRKFPRPDEDQDEGYMLKLKDPYELFMTLQSCRLLPSFVDCQNCSIAGEYIEVDVSLDGGYFLCPCCSKCISLRSESQLGTSLEGKLSLYELFTILLMWVKGGREKHRVRFVHIEKLPIALQWCLELNYSCHKWFDKFTLTIGGPFDHERRNSIKIGKFEMQILEIDKYMDVLIMQRFSFGPCIIRCNTNFTNTDKFFADVIQEHILPYSRLISTFGTAQLSMRTPYSHVRVSTRQPNSTILIELNNNLQSTFDQFVDCFEFYSCQRGFEHVVVGCAHEIMTRRLCLSKPHGFGDFLFDRLACTSDS